jgi:hypothetical protein
MLVVGNVDFRGSAEGVEGLVGDRGERLRIMVKLNFVWGKSAQGGPGGSAGKSDRAGSALPLARGARRQAPSPTCSAVDRPSRSALRGSGEQRRALRRGGLVEGGKTRRRARLVSEPDTRLDDEHRDSASPVA